MHLGAFSLAMFRENRILCIQILLNVPKQIYVFKVDLQI